MRRNVQIGREVFGLLMDAEGVLQTAFHCIPLLAQAASGGTQCMDQTSVVLRTSRRLLRSLMQLLCSLVSFADLRYTRDDSAGFTDNVPSALVVGTTERRSDHVSNYRITRSFITIACSHAHLVPLSRYLRDTSYRWESSVFI